MPLRNETYSSAFGSILRLGFPPVTEAVWRCNSSFFLILLLLYMGYSSFVCLMQLRREPFISSALLHLLKTLNLSVNYKAASLSLFFFIVITHATDTAFKNSLISYRLLCKIQKFYLISGLHFMQSCSCTPQDYNGIHYHLSFFLTSIAVLLSKDGYFVIWLVIAYNCFFFILAQHQWA